MFFFASIAGPRHRFASVANVRSDQTSGMGLRFCRDAPSPQTAAYPPIPAVQAQRPNAGSTLHARPKIPSNLNSRAWKTRPNLPHRLIRQGTKEAHRSPRCSARSVHLPSNSQRTRDGDCSPPPAQILDELAVVRSARSPVLARLPSRFEEGLPEVVANGMAGGTKGRISEA